MGREVQRRSQQGDLCQLSVSSRPARGAVVPARQLGASLGTVPVPCWAHGRCTVKARPQSGGEAWPDPGTSTSPLQTDQASTVVPKFSSTQQLSRLGTVIADEGMTRSRDEGYRRRNKPRSMAVWQAAGALPTPGAACHAPPEYWKGALAALCPWGPHTAAQPEVLTARPATPSFHPQSLTGHLSRGRRWLAWEEEDKWGGCLSQAHGGEPGLQPCWHLWLHPQAPPLGIGEPTTEVQPTLPTPAGLWEDAVTWGAGVPWRQARRHSP